MGERIKRGYGATQRAKYNRFTDKGESMGFLKHLTIKEDGIVSSFNMDTGIITTEAKEPSRGEYRACAKCFFAFGERNLVPLFQAGVDSSLNNKPTGDMVFMPLKKVKAQLGKSLWVCPVCGSCFYEGAGE